MRCLGNPVLDESTMPIKNTPPIATHPGWGDRTGLPVALGPLDHAGNRNTKSGGNRTTALTSLKRKHNTFTKIIGTGSNHTC